ncbi:MAG TPA: hypothetical protein VIG30_18010, partial [Ktedonobacterales bacterium]
MSSSATSPTPITAAPAVPQDPYRPALGVAITLLFWLWCLLAYLAVVLVAGVASGVLLACGTHPALACGPLGVDIWRALAGRLGLFIAGLTPAGQIAALALVALGVAAVWAGVVRTRALAAYRRALRASRRTWRTSGAERLRRADAAAAAYHTATTRAWAAPRGYWGREWGQLAILLAARAELTPADQRARLLDEPLAAAATALAALDRRPHLPRLQLYAWVAAHSAQSVVLAFRAQPLAADEQRTFLAGTIAELRLARAALPARAPHAVATPVAILDNALCARLREWANLLPPAERAAPLAEAAVLYQASANALARRPWLRAGSL